MTTRFGRRQFLASGAIAIAVPSVMAVARPGRGQSTETTDHRTIFKSLKWGMIGAHGSVREKFQLVGEVGFDGLELDSPGNVKPDEARAAALATGVAMEGVVDSTHWQVRLTDPDQDVRVRARRDLTTAIQDCHAAGGSSVLLVPGHGRDGSVADVKRRAREQIRAVLPLSARLGIRVLIENVWNEMFYRPDGNNRQTADELAEFVDAFRSPWVGVHFDVGNHQKYGRPADWIRTLGPRIAKLDIKDWSQRNGFCKIGDGDVDWDDVRAALREIGYTGWAAAEVEGGDRERLADISNRMDRALAL